MRSIHYSNFRRARFFIQVVLLSVLSHFNMHAQTGTITGKVTDKTGKPLVNATISVEKTYYGTTTNESGHYTPKKIPAGRYIIQFSFVSYQSLTRPAKVHVDETTQLNFEAEEKPLEFTSLQSAGSFGMFNSFNSIGGQTGKFILNKKL